MPTTRKTKNDPKMQEKNINYKNFVIMKKNLKPLLLLIAVLIIVSCGQDNESGFNITLKNTDSYTYNYLDHIEWEEGDEVKWTIQVQAQNYEISEVVKTDSTDRKSVV